MKKINTLIVILFVTLLSCDNEPKEFSKKALTDTFVTLDDKSISLKNILESHKGKPIVIDIWASWCSDCIKGMPKVKALQEKYKGVAYVFLSLDRSVEAWKRGIEKYDVKGDHYFMASGKDCDFANFVNISWIPRYMVINKAGEIVVFNVIEANDDKLIEALKK